MDKERIIEELNFKAIRSSGAGGQHVNKTASKVELAFHILNSKGLTEVQKQLLQEKLSARLTSGGTLMLQCGGTRSQHRNKKLVIERLFNLLQENLVIDKPRKKTKPSNSAIQKRLKSKKKQALRKANRKPPQTD